MAQKVNRRDFMQLAAAGGGAFGVAGLRSSVFGAAPARSKLISPGNRRSKVKVARLYVGVPKAHYPTPKLDLKAEMKVYQAEFAKMKNELTDVEFFVDEWISSPDQVKALKDRLSQADGILVIHLTLATLPILREILALGRPTMIFSLPYAGHEWHSLISINKQKLGENMVCLLTSDYRQLAAAIRPFRAIHHLREAKILNVAAKQSAQYVSAVKDKFGVEIKRIDLEQVLAAYNAVPDGDARAEAKRWTKGARRVVEPSPEEILKSCKLALAFDRLLDEEDATVMTVDCYGSMWSPLCRPYAYPCIGFTRLNDMGFGGICQSDLPCALIHVLFQGLTGRPSFVCNPTFDYATNSIVLIHCLGTRKMDGPNGPAAPYNLRSIMEREEGAVPQVRMRIGQRITAAMLDGTSTLSYFTGQITETPETDRGCRTKIRVRLDGSAENLWKNWVGEIHRVACYGDLVKDLEHFCRFKQIPMVSEAS
jgi:hypothetical protein